MKMVLPVEGYSSAGELMSALQGSQGDTFWLFKQQGHWHGGIHLNDRFYAGGVYNPSGQGHSGLKAMTDGHIVAYRLNDDYLTAAYKHNSLPKAFRFTSTFVLIKSTCTPDVEKPDNALDFYTLWVQLAPLSVYGVGANPTAKVAASSLKVRQDNPTLGWVRSGLPQGAAIPTSTEGRLPYAVPVESQAVLARGSVVEILEEANFFLNGKVAPFVFMRVKTVPEGRTSTVEAGMTGWVSGLAKYLKREQRSVPVWMEAARKKGILNEVVTLKGDEAIRVNAGDVIGHMGRHESPFEAPYHFCHLEVFSQDSRLPDFVANKAGVTKGEPLVRSLAGKTRYMYSESENRFVVCGEEDDPLTTHEDRFTPMSKSDKKTVEGKDWYYIAGENSWLPAGEVTVINQFDLAKRGFVLLAEDAPPQDVLKARQEPWFRDVFERLKVQADSNTKGMYSAAVSEGYQRLLRQMDLDGDGKISNSELWKHLHCREKHIQDQLQRFIVKHHSEWVHDASSALWQGTLAEMAKRFPGDAEYNRQHINAMVWMKHVSELRSGEALWHLHPVSFLEAVSSKPRKREIKGKLTYDAEGNNVPSSIYYSRVIHWPGNDLSGVTLGRGYDMGGRSRVEVYNDMIASGIESTQASKISNGAGLKGGRARDFVSENKVDIGEITLSQQESLFDIVYPKYIERAINNYKSWTRDVVSAKEWDELDIPIQEVLVDFVYQGFTQGPRPMLAGSNNDKQELINYIRNTPAISQYEEGRHRVRYLESAE
ncbi:MULTISPECIES: pesticin C-terminus-like muramidase [unclassified Serratia (in: enterobacteria)]|uniref:pesticin C-terminus-like muramidase n=1 Tax=unclassified Serratia (in: enterobacteria) TaxID=2647522 RepID=UPI0030762C31